MTFKFFPHSVTLSDDDRYIFLHDQFYNNRKYENYSGNYRLDNLYEYKLGIDLDRASTIFSHYTYILIPTLNGKN